MGSYLVGSSCYKFHLNKTCKGIFFEHLVLCDDIFAVFYRKDGEGMEQYDEKYFRAKANIRAGITFLVVMVLTTVFYFFKMNKGEVEQDWFIKMVAIGWSLFFAASLSITFKGKDYKYYRYFNRIR